MLQSLKIVSEFRRIFVMVLLFTFCGMSLIAQKPDTIQAIIDTTELKPLAPGQEPVRSSRVQPRTEALEDPQPDTIQQAEILTDTVQIDEHLLLTADSTKIDLQDVEHSPKKAMIYAIVLPGAGQAYNKKYWKIPIVYAALGGAGYAIYYNTQNYRLALEELALNPFDASLDRKAKGWRRYMEMSYIAVVLVDALAVVDAYVDAHLFFWDVDPDLSIRVEPAIQPLFNPNGYMMNAYGVRASFTF